MGHLQNAFIVTSINLIVGCDSVREVAPTEPAVDTRDSLCESAMPSFERPIVALETFERANTPISHVSELQCDSDDLETLSRIDTSYGCTEISYDVAEFADGRLPVRLSLSRNEPTDSIVLISAMDEFGATMCTQELVYSVTSTCNAELEETSLGLIPPDATASTICTLSFDTPDDRVRCSRLRGRLRVLFCGDRYRLGLKLEFAGCHVTQR
ncbi:hypothetical protein Pan14r_18090 [Crateriforma conspicua]|uniref:Uncharacterized protein n=1 Tax=Crateriforma conspicua TaxID=2527996 RepID=A0A5C5Y4F8_9PLAN|nr:hypothetical protein Pan14r_18090 [Crateriforma conspicua]